MSKFEIIKAGPVIGKRRNGVEVRLNIMSWYGKMPVYDVRNWDKDIAQGGISLSPDMAKALRDELDLIDFGEES